MSENRIGLGIELSARDTGAEAMLKRLEAQAKSLEQTLREAEAKVTAFSANDLTIKANIQGLEGAQQNVELLRATLAQVRGEMAALQSQAARGGFAPAISTLADQDDSQRQEIIRRLEASEARNQISGLVFEKGRYRARRFDESEGAEGEEAERIAGQRTQAAKTQVFQSFRQDDAEEYARRQRDRAITSTTPLGSTAVQGAEWARRYNSELERQVRLLSQANAEAAKYKATTQALSQQTLQSTRVGDTSEVLRRAEAEKIALQRVRTGDTSRIVEENARAVEEAEQKIRESISRTTAEHNRAQLERLRAQQTARTSTRPALDETTAGTIDRVTGVSRSASIAQEELEAAFGRTSRSARGAGAGMQGLYRDSLEASKGVSGLSFVLQRAAIELGEFERGQRGQMISSLITTLRRAGSMGVGSLAVAAPLATIGGAVALERTIAGYGLLAEKTLNAAAAAGVGVEQYSRLQRIFQVLSGDVNRLPIVFETISQSIEQALEAPAGPKAGAFAQILGPDYESKLKSFQLNIGQGLDVLRQKFQEFGPNSYQAIELFRQALGRGVDALAPFLRLTTEHLGEITKAVDQSSSALSGPEAAALSKVSEASRELGLEFSGLGKEIALLAANTSFIEFLSSVVEKIKEGIGVASGFAAGVRNLANIPGQLAQNISGATETPAQKEQKVTDFFAARQDRRFGEGPAPAIPTITGPQATLRPPIAQPSTDRIRGDETRGGEVYGPPVPKEIETYRSAAQIREKLDRELRPIEGRARVDESAIRTQVAIAQANGDRAKALALETQRITVQEQLLQKEQQMREQEAKRVEQVQGPGAGKDLANQIRDTSRIETELNNLRTQRVELAARYANEEYSNFAASKREEIVAARGSATAIMQIYQELFDRTKEQYGELDRRTQEVAREMVRAGQEATDKLIQDRMRLANSEISVIQSQAKTTELTREIEAIGQGGVGKVDRTAAIREEIQALQVAGQQEIAIYEETANIAGATAEQKEASLLKAWQVSQEIYGKEVQLAHTLAEEQKKAAEEGAKVFTDAFRKAGTETESLLDAAIFKTKTRQEAFRDFFLSLDKTIIHSVETIGSQLAAQGLAKATGTELAPGKGLSDLFGSMVGRLFGLGEKPDAQAGIQGVLSTANQQRAQGNELLGRIRAIIEQQKQDVAKVQENLAKVPGATPAVSGPSSGNVNVPMTDQYADTISNAAQAYNLPPQVLYNLVRAESGFDPKARSSAGAEGLGQFIPSTAKEYGVDVKDPTSSIYGAAHYLSDLREQTGSLTKAVSAYNMGPRGAERSGYSLKAYEGYSQGQDLIASAKAADSPVPVRIVSGTTEKTLSDPAGIEVSHVNIAEVGGSAVSSQDTNRELGVGRTLARTPQPAVSPIDQFLDYGLFGKSLGLEKPVLRAGGEVKGFQFGGPPNSVDTVPAWLSPGEFVVRRDAVDHYGTGAFHALNSKSLPKFERGGEVSSGSSYQSGGAVISFPFAASPGEQLQRLIEIERSKAIPDYSKVREWESTTVNLGRLWKPGMAPGRECGGKVTGFDSGGFVEGESGGGGWEQKDSLSPVYETPEQAEMAVRKILSGISYGGDVEDRSWKEIMEASPPSGFAGNREDLSSYLRPELVQGANLKDNHLKDNYWYHYGVGLRDKIQSDEMSPVDAMREAERVAPIGQSGMLTQFTREAFLPPEEVTSISGAAGFHPWTEHGTAPNPITGFQAGGLISQMINESVGKDPLGLPAREPGLYSTPPMGITSSIDPSLAFVHGTGASEAVQSRIGQAESIALAFGPGILAGQSSATADIFALKQAQRLMRQATRPTEEMIANKGWEKYGWGNRSPDLKWRYEIPDVESHWNDSVRDPAIQANENSVKLSQIFEHNKLYEAYPHLRNIDVKPIKDLEYSGSMFGNDLSIRSDLMGTFEGHSVLLHELQHAVQTREGFTGGSAPEWFLPKWKVPKNSIEAIDAYDVAYDKYWRTAGEVEARAVESRYKTLALEDLRKVPFWESFSVPLEQQILPGFQTGGLVPIKQGGVESIPVTTESRGFVTPHLVQAFPQPKLGPLLAILGVAGAGLGLAAVIESITKEEKLAKKLLETPDMEDGTKVTSRTTTPIPQDHLPEFHFGGAVQSFQRGGVSKEILANLRSDEVLGKLQTGERVLSRHETHSLDQIPQFHSGGIVSFAGGGHVWPAFASGGTVDTSSPTYSPPVASSDSGAKIAIEGVAHLSSSMGALAGDVEKVSKGFTALERGTTQTQSATARLSSGLSAASSAVSGFQSILGAIGGSGGGILGSAGGLLGGAAKIAGLFALEQGGIIPSAMRGMIVGGLPSFAQGGILSLLHQQEMVLPAHISNFIQGAAASYTGTRGQAQDLGGGTVNNTFHISGVVNSHDVGKLFMQHYGTIMKAFQRGSRNGFETP